MGLGGQVDGHRAVDVAFMTPSAVIWSGNFFFMSEHTFSAEVSPNSNTLALVVILAIG